MHTVHITVPSYFQTVRPYHLDRDLLSGEQGPQGWPELGLATGTSFARGYVNSSTMLTWKIDHPGSSLPPLHLNHFNPDVAFLETA